MPNKNSKMGQIDQKEVNKSISSNGSVELPSAWKTKVRQMLLEGLSSQDTNESTVLGRTSSFGSDVGLSTRRRRFFADFDFAQHTEKQYHRYLESPGDLSLDLGADAKSIDTVEIAEEEILQGECVRILKRLAKATRNLPNCEISAEEVSTLCELFNRQYPAQSSVRVTSEYIDSLPEQLFDTEIKDYLMREYPDSSNRFLPRYSSKSRSPSDGSSLSRAGSMRSSPISSSVDLRRTFSLTKSLINGDNSTGPALRSYRSYTEVLRHDEKGSNGKKSMKRRQYQPLQTSSKDSGTNGGDSRKPKTLLEVDIALTEKLYQKLLKIDEWTFNIHEIQNLAPKGAMVAIGFALFERHRLLEIFKIPEDTVQRFLSKLQKSYRKNPYHNWIHACDCAQTMSHLILKCGFSMYTSDVLRFALVFSALAHDVAHPGVTNNYLTKISHPLAVRYNDKSPLEMMHASTAFEIALNPKFAILEGLDTGQYDEFRHAAITLILATDNAEHNFLVSKIEKLGSAMQTEGFVCNEGDQLALMSAALHAADISSSAKPWRVYNEWTKRLTVEFRLQGDLERKRNMPVLPFMDRNSEEPIARLQASFIMAICKPLYKQLDGIKHINLAHALSYIESNLEKWKTFTTQKGENSDCQGQRTLKAVMRGVGVERAVTLFKRVHEKAQAKAMPKTVSCPVELESDESQGNPQGKVRKQRSISK